LRLAKLRPQAGQAHMPVMAPVSRDNDDER
jgi:hypothetical protein